MAATLQAVKEEPYQRPLPKVVPINSRAMNGAASGTFAQVAIHTFEVDYQHPDGPAHTVRITIADTGHVNWGSDHPYLEALLAGLAAYQVNVFSVRHIREHAVEVGDRLHSR